VPSVNGQANEANCTPAHFPG